MSRGAGEVGIPARRGRVAGLAGPAVRGMELAKPTVGSSLAGELQARPADGEGEMFSVMKRPERGRARRLCVAPVVSNRGAALVAVVAIVSAVLLFGVALFILGSGEADVVEYGVDGARAFYLAESGVERARAYLEQLLEEDSAVDPVGMTFESQLLGGGTYTATIVSELTSGTWVRIYEVVSTGWKDGVPRQIRAELEEETFAHYQEFIDQGGWRWFKTGERFEGPVHTNFDLQIDGDPWFGGRVTAGGGLTMKTGSNPTFVKGYELHVDNIDLPKFTEVEAIILPAANDGGLYAGPLNGTAAYYEVELGRDGLGTFSYRTYQKNGSVYEMSDWSAPVVINTTNGAIWFGAPIHLSGVLDGQMTIVSEGTVTIMDDVVYADSAPGGGPNPGCDDLLGLIAENDIVISSTILHDCVLDGALMALWKDFVVEDYMHGAPRGLLKIYGGIMVQQSIHIGQYDHDVCISGFVRDYHWDKRLNSWWPLFYPKTNRCFVRKWDEIVPPEV
jgi:hypothetical protein